MIRYHPNFFALGFGIERITNCDETERWTALAVKVFLGGWIYNGHFRIGRKRRVRIGG